MRKNLLVAVAVFFLAITAAGPRAAQTPAPAAGGRADDWIMYVGTYTRAPSKGIYAYRFRSATGEVTPIATEGLSAVASADAGLAAETENPSFVAVHPNQRFLYAVNEISRYEGRDAGSVSAFAIDRATGRLTLLNRVSSRGGGPCHLSIDATGKWLFVANYGGGSVAAFPLRDDGTLGEASAFAQHAGSSVNPARQKGPHAHAAVVSPDNHFVLTADLGLDRILTYPLDAAAGGLVTGSPRSASIAAGSGPRHLAFRPDGRFVYVLNEMSSSVGAFRYDARRGTLSGLQTLSTLPDGFTGDNSGAEVAVHPGARFLYASNRGHDSIAIFRIDPARGTLAAVGHVSTQGRTPRNFAIDPSGRFLVAANQNSGSLVMFRIDQDSGRLTPAGSAVEVPSPVSVVFARPSH